MGLGVPVGSIDSDVEIAARTPFEPKPGPQISIDSPLTDMI